MELLHLVERPTAHVQRRLHGIGACHLVEVAVVYVEAIACPPMVEDIGDEGYLADELEEGAYGLLAFGAPKGHAAGKAHPRVVFWAHIVPVEGKAHLAELVDELLSAVEELLQGHLSLEGIVYELPDLV